MASLSVTLVPEEKRSEWNRFVDAHPDALSWHGYDWARFLAAHYRVAFLPLAAYEGSELRGILPLYRVKTRRTGVMLVSIPYFVAGGIVATSAEAAKSLGDAALVLSSESQTPLFLKSYRTPAPGPFRTDSSFYNRELDLSPGIEAIWDQLEPGNRDRIEESQRLPVAVEYPSGRVGDFYRLMARHEHALGRPWVRRTWLDSLLATGMYRPAMLTLRDEPVAATLVKRYKDTVSYPLTCLREQDDATVTLACRLYWELIQTVAADGIRISHSGRIPEDGSVPAYRLGWGGTAYRYHYQYSGRDHEKTDSESRSGDLRGTFERVWPRIPRPVAGVISPTIVKQFP